MVLLTDGFTADSDECLRQAQKASAAGLTISTVGVGMEFNEELLINIAEMSKGNAYFIQDPQDIPAVFAQELSGVQAIALRNLELKLRLTGGVELRKAYRAKPVIADLGRARWRAAAPVFPWEIWSGMRRRRCCWSCWCRRGPRATIDWPRSCWRTTTRPRAARSEGASRCRHPVRRRRWATRRPIRA